MTEHLNPVDRALDLFVFAPIGLALSARDLFPKLADKGHQQVESQLAMARVVGEFAVREGQRQAEKRIGRLTGQVKQALTELGLSGETRPSLSAPEPRLPTRPEPADTASPRPAADARVWGNGRVGAPARTSDDALAIPGYDNLSASQVVQRLDGLSREELEAVRAYESAGRGRKTILSKIAQLQLAS